MTNLKKNSIIDGVIWKQLLIFFFPILFGTFFQQLYNTADAIIVGNFVGKEALGAVGGSTATIINLLVGLFVGLSTGASVVIAQYYGAYDSNKLKKAVSTSIVVAIVGGFILMIIGFFSSSSILEMMNTPTELFDYSLVYMQVYFIGIIPSLIYNMGSGILRSVGDVKRPLYFLIVACVVNIVLDVVFVVFFKWAVFGVALATIISQCVSAILVIYALSNKDEPYYFQIKKLNCDNDILKRIIIIGVPAGVQSVLYALSNILIQTYINGFGTDTVAAYTAYGKIDAFFWMGMGAFGIAISTFVGQNFGAKKYDRMKKSVWVCLGMAYCFTIILSITLLIFGPKIFLLFTNDLNVLKIGSDILHQLVPIYVTFVAIEILSCATRATGDAFIPTIMTALGVVGIRVLWLVCVNHETVNSVLQCFPISWTITSLIFFVYYLHGGWFKRRVKAQS